MPPISTSFAAPWDRQLRICTALVCALVITLAILLPSQLVALWFVKGGLLLLLLGTWAWAPKSYRIEAKALVVERWIGSVRMPLHDLRHARRIDPEELRGAVRTWGVGGSFGYYGRFLNGIEPQTWYVTDRNSCVRFECSAGVIVISPSSPADFLSALPLSASS